jgi:inosine-uridine nucleoside N-ribohydrolase
MGGDDLWAIALLLANQDKFHIQGFTSVFGNTNVDTATRNARNFINALGYGHLPVVSGARSPIDGTLPFGDDAYGDEGVGGVTFPESPYDCKNIDAATWMHRAIQENSQPVTIFATGPASNLADLLTRYPDAAKSIERIIFMAGADTPPGRHGKPVTLGDGSIRRGNITPYAEFNAFQDPHALNVVIESGVACHFLTMDSNQHLVLTPERIKALQALNLRYGNEMLQMLAPVAELDKEKFGVKGAFIHDPNVILYALRPELYNTINSGLRLQFNEQAPIEGTLRGEASLIHTPKRTGSVHWATTLNTPDEAFSIMLDMFKKVLGPKQRPTPAGARCNPTPR